MSNANDITRQMNRILAEYSDELDRKADEALAESSKDTVKMLKKTSPVGAKTPRSGRYAKGWRFKKEDNGGYRVYNATDYQLTHLLENGHELVAWGVSTGKRTRSFPHIKSAADYGAQQLIKKLEDI